jgi:hypothetical protein
MSAAPCRAKAEPPPGARCLRRAPAGLALAAGLLLAVGGAGPAPGESVPRDLRLTVAARRALGQDRELAGLNLGVSVRRGVADLWGTVPSAALAERAVGRLRQIEGLTSVRNELTVEPRPDAGGSAPEDPPEGRSSPRPEKPPPAGALAGLGSTPGLAPGRPASHPADRAEPAAPLDAAVSLGPPVAPRQTTPAGPRPLAELGRVVALPDEPRPAVDSGGSTASPPDPSGAVEQLRQGDERFRRLRPEVRGGVVTVRGAVRRGEDLMAFARAVSGLPGVERVILAPVQVDGQR